MATHDTLIHGGRLIDGAGNPWVRADVALAGGRIAAVAPPGLLDGTAAETVDAGDLAVCPGFIDIQSHSIVPFLTDRRSLSKVTQGVTTEIMGEAWTPSPAGGLIANPFPEELRSRLGDALDGWNALAAGWTRFAPWLEDLAARGVSVNVGSFLGHGTLREYAMGYDMAPASDAQIAVMRRVMAEAMEDGAFGLATALIYPPSSYATFEELVAVMEVVAAYRGVHITHMRSEETRILEALGETIEIARRTGVATEIYHLKAAGRGNWGLMPEVIARIEAARAEGLDVTADMYPYEAAGTGLATVLPTWAEADGKLWDNLADPAMRERIRQDIVNPPPGFENLGAVEGATNVVLAGLLRPDLEHLNGRVLADVARERGQHWADTAMDLLHVEGQNIFCFYFEMSDDNIRRQLQLPWIKISTDAGGVDPADLAGQGWHHPRAFGSYPRVLGHYCRDEGVIGLEDAVRKMTSSVAARLGIRDRGLIAPGMAADVVIFDPARIADRATFSDPHQLPVGVRDVWVNGERVLAAAPRRWRPGVAPVWAPAASTRSPLTQTSRTPTGSWCGSEKVARSAI
ncbi:MAG: N-acyl-D-amino-acid deacylase family protein, partial [Chloroflexota bacterium]